MHKGADELLCRIVRDTRPRCTWSDSTSAPNALDDTQRVLRAKQVQLHLKTATWNAGLWRIRTVPPEREMLPGLQRFVHP